MIVNQHVRGWEIITHFTHGLVAGKIGHQLESSLKKDHETDILAAIIQHDDLLANPGEVTYLTKAGAPMDFTQRARTEKEALLHAERIYTHASQKSQLMALLIGRHLEFLNGAAAKKGSKMYALLHTIQLDRKRQRSLYKIDPATEEALYHILLFCDRLSLIILQRQIPAIQRALEINTTINNQTYFIKNVVGNTNEIYPWIFEKDQFELTYESRIVTQLSFSSNKEFFDTLLQTPPKLNTVLLKNNIKE